MIQAYHSFLYAQRTGHRTPQMLAQLCRLLLKGWHMSMEYYSATDKNEVMSFGGRWRKLENTMLSKAPKVKYHIFPHQRLLALNFLI